MCGSKHPNVGWPFFVGMYEGAIGRPGYLGFGAIRTATWLGWNGAEPRSNIVFHNYLTYMTAKQGYYYVRHGDTDSTQLAVIWSHLPKDTQNNTIEWGAKTLGGLVGGMAVNSMISKQLVRFVPKQIVFPVMTFIGCQGFMASVWRDQWGGGPPPPPAPPGGGSGSGLAV